jgi:hypothetical protein
MKYTSRFYYYKLSSISYYNPDNPVSKQFAASGAGLETFIKSYNLKHFSRLPDWPRNYLIAGTDIQWNNVGQPAGNPVRNQQVNNFGAFVQHQYKIIKDNSGSTILSSQPVSVLTTSSLWGGANLCRAESFVRLLTQIPSAILENTSFRSLRAGFSTINW